MGCLPQPVTSGLNDIVSVIYTSGSTGFAKGKLVLLCNYIMYAYIQGYVCVSVCLCLSVCLFISLCLCVCVISFHNFTKMYYMLLHVFYALICIYPISASKYLLCICDCAGVPFTNRTCLKSTLGCNIDCEVVICKGT